MAPRVDRTKLEIVSVQDDDDSNVPYGTAAPPRSAGFRGRSCGGSSKESQLPEDLREFFKLLGEE
jgi:hypothetical protein